MGQEIVYCFKCQSRLLSSDFEKGRAVRHGNHVACAGCAPEVAASEEPRRDKPAPATPRASHAATPRRASSPAPRGTSPALYAGAAAGAALLLVLLVLASGGKPTAPPPRPPDAPAPKPAPSKREDAEARKPDPLDVTRTYLRELAELDGRAKPLAAAERFGEAAALFEAARERHPGDVDWKALLDGKSDEIRKEARRLLQGLGEAAVAARKAGKAADIRRARDRVERWGLPPLLAELDAALAAVPEESPWRELFDGRSLDFLVNDSRSGWRVENGRLARSEIDNTAQTRESFADGELRFRFEIEDPLSLVFDLRQDHKGAYEVGFPRNVLEAWGPGVRELLVRLDGASVSAAIDGRPVEVRTLGTPNPLGRVRFRGRGKSLRFHSIAVRGLALIPGEPLVLRARRALISGGKTFIGGKGDASSIEAIGEESRIAWVVELPRPGRFRVELESSCPSNNGGRFSLHLGQAKLDAPSPVTGSWNDYKTWPLGTVELPRGPLEIHLRTHESKGGLFNLRSIRLVPE